MRKGTPQRKKKKTVRPSETPNRSQCFTGVALRPSPVGHPMTFHVCRDQSYLGRRRLCLMICAGYVAAFGLTWATRPVLGGQPPLRVPWRLVLTLGDGLSSLEAELI